MDIRAEETDNSEPIAVPQRRQNERSRIYGPKINMMTVKLVEKLGIDNKENDDSNMQIDQLLTLLELLVMKDSTQLVSLSCFS